MKKKLIATTLVSLLGLCAQADEATTATSTVTTSHSEPRFGAGVILGEPTGASLKYWLNDTMAIDGAIGASFYHETDLGIHGDILWHNFDLLPVPRGKLPVYFGVGARVKFRDN